CLAGYAQGVGEEIIGLHEAAADAINTPLIDDIGPVVGDCDPVRRNAGPPGCTRTLAPVVVKLDGDRPGKNLVCKHPDPAPNGIARVLGSECENYAWLHVIILRGLPWSPGPSNIFFRRRVASIAVFAFAFGRAWAALRKTHVRQNVDDPLLGGLRPLPLWKPERLLQHLPEGGIGAIPQPLVDAFLPSVDDEALCLLDRGERLKLRAQPPWRAAFV